jgi:hypothetical protein
VRSLPSNGSSERLKAFNADTVGVANFPFLSDASDERSGDDRDGVAAEYPDTAAGVRNDSEAE